MAYSYDQGNVVNLKHLKKVAVRTQEEMSTLAGAVADAIEEVLGITVKGNLRVFYGTCSTAASTASKAVTIDGIESLIAGDVYIIVFENAQSYNGTPKLNINTLGDQNIKRLTGTNAAKDEWDAGEALIFVWNGTCFLICNGTHATTTHFGVTKLTSAVDSTSETLAATAKAVKTVYDAIDASDTTYTLTQDASDGHIITLTPSQGDPMTITIPDNNTEYELITEAEIDSMFT